MRDEKLSARSVAGGILLSGMTATVALGYGFQYRADAEHPLGYFLPISSAFFFCLLLLLASFLLPSLAAAKIRRNLAGSLGLGLMSLSLSLTLLLHEPELPVSVPLAAAALLIGSMAAIGLRLGRAATAAVLVLGLFVQGFLALTVPLDVEAANMLPIIGAGCELLIGLDNPYLARFPDIASEPLIYLPGLVVPYCLPTAAGIDMRWVNVVIIVAITAYACWNFRGWSNPERLSLGLWPLLLSPIAAQMMIHGHVWSYWLLVVVFVHALATQRFLAAALVLGLMLATRQMSLFLAVPAAAYMSTRLRPLDLLGYAAATLAMYLAVMAPVMLTTPGWIERFYLGLSGIGQRLHLSYGNPMNQVSLSGLLTEMGLAGLLRPLQAVVLLLTAAAFWIWRQRIDFPRALVLLGFCYVLVIGLNTFLHRYFYVPGLILLALGVACSASPSQPVERKA